MTSWDHRPKPAGFGPMPGHWSPRVELAGTYDDQWRKERFPLVPNDFDEHFYLCSPIDQRAPKYLRGGELVELQNLTPTGVLRFSLPSIALSFTTYFYGQEPLDHHAVLHTVIIEPDVPRVMMVWEAELPCHHDGLKLRETAIYEGEHRTCRD